jgi:hypothetical protein
LRGQSPLVVARAHQDVKGVELDIVIMLAAMQAVEVGDTVDAEQHGFAINDEGVEPVTQRGFDNARVPAAPVVAVAGPQPHGLAVPLNDQAVAVMLDLMKPLRWVWNSVPRVGMHDEAKSVDSGIPFGLVPN